MSVRSARHMICRLAFAPALLWCFTMSAEEPVLEKTAVRLLNDGSVNFVGATSPWLGIEVESAGEALRAQLDLPQGHGLVVTQVSEDGPANSKLARNDVLLSFNDRPLTKPEDLDLRLAENALKPVRIAYCRSGKIQAVEITPKSRDFVVHFVNVDVDMPQTSYWLGVQLAPADETLRAQLKLTDGQGLVVLEVLDAPSSPAAKAGVQPHDVVLQINERRLSAVEELAAELQTIGDRMASLRLLRAGQPLTLNVTPAKRVNADAVTLYGDLYQHMLVKEAAPPDRKTLIEWIYRDIAGTPPSAEQVEQQVNDETPDAAARLIEQLLSQPEQRAQFSRRWVEQLLKAPAVDQPQVNSFGAVWFDAANVNVVRSNDLTLWVAGAVDAQATAAAEVQANAAPSVAAQVKQLTEELARLQALAAKLQESIEKSAGETTVEKKE